MVHDLIWTLSALLDALKDPFAFALLITASVLVIGYYSKQNALSFFISIALTFSATHIVKSIFATPRPDLALIDVTGYRFPSLHASIAGAICASVWWYVWTNTKSPLVRLGATIVLVGAVLLVSWTRVRLGVHLPIDVAVGSLLGVLITLAVHATSRRMFVVQ